MHKITGFGNIFPFLLKYNNKKKILSLNSLSNNLCVSKCHSTFSFFSSRLLNPVPITLFTFKKGERIYNFSLNDKGKHI